MNTKSFGKSAIALLLVFVINSIVDLFIYTFFTAHLLTITNNDISFISGFYMILYAALGLTFLLVGRITKKIKHINMLRIGAVLKGLFILLVIILGDKIVEHFVWLAIIYGFFEGIFWSGANTIKNLVVDSDRIKLFVSLISINGRIVGIVFPLIFGISIDATSFNVMAIVVLCLITIQIGITFIVRQTKIFSSSGGLMAFIKALKTNEQAKFVNGSYWLLFLRGLQFFIPTFITYLIIYVLKTNTSLGILTTVASVIAIVILVLFNVLKKVDSNIWLYLIFTICEVATFFLCLIFRQPIFIIIFQIVYTAVKTTIDSMSEGLRGSAVRDANLGDFMTENIIITELCLNFGRVIGFLALFILGLVNSLFATILLGCIFAVFLILYNMFTGIVKKKISHFKNEHLLVIENNNIDDNKKDLKI